MKSSKSTSLPSKKAKLTATNESSTCSSSDSTVIMDDQEITVGGDNGLDGYDSDSGLSFKSMEETVPSRNYDDGIEFQSIIISECFSPRDLDGISDPYFMPKTKTTDGFFEKFKIEIAHIHEKEFMQIVKNEFEQLHFDLEPDMSIYFSLLMENINIMFYGYGSKISIFRHFAETQLKDKVSYITINGFKPYPILKDILDCFNETIQRYTDKKVTDQNELIEIVRNKFQEKDLVVIIHSIDRLIQDANNLIKPFLLRLFAPGSRIHLIASSDHVNFDLQWSSKDVSLLNLHMVLLNTSEPYLREREAKFEAVWPLFIQELDKKMVGYDSIPHVYQSSNQTSQQIFLVLLDQFLKMPKKSSLKFFDFKESCQNAFGKREDSYYKTQLIEFTSHGLLKFKKNQDVGEIIQLNIDRNDAKRFLDLHRDELNDII